MPELIRGDAAVAALGDPHFLAEWEALHGACPWATVFQHPVFVRTWARHYVPPFELLLLLDRDAGGALTALLPLTVAAGERQITAAGDVHSEYQTFLARPGHGDEFMRACLERLSQELPTAMLRLAYVPAAAPLAWVTEGRWAAHAHVRPAPRMLADTADPQIQQDLKKRATRWRMNRLAQHGPLRFGVIDDPDEFDALAPTIVDVCDFRQAAANGSAPFRDDPRKLPFHRDLLRETSLLHVTALRAGDRLLSVQLNMMNGPDLLLCVLGHHPAAARHSPGHLHMLMLAALLAESGVPRFDLSPEGTYKERLATDQDTTHAVHVHLGRVAAARFRWSRRLMATGRSTLDRLGVDPKAVRRLVDEARVDGGRMAVPRTAARAVRHFVRHERAVTMFEAPDSMLGDLPSPVAPAAVRTDSLDDLLLYRPLGAEWPSRQEFLSQAMRALSLGEQVFTVRDGDVLRACAWLAPARERLHPDELGGVEARLPTGAALVHGVLAAGDAGSPADAVLDAALAAARALSPAPRVFVLMGDAESTVRCALVARRFVERFRVSRQVRFGRLHTHTDMPSQFVPAPPPDGDAATPAAKLADA